MNFKIFRNLFLKIFLVIYKNIKIEDSFLINLFLTFNCNFRKYWLVNFLDKKFKQDPKTILIIFLFDLFILATLVIVEFFDLF